MSQIFKQFELDFPVIIDIPVQWGDMDAFNHVNNVTYFKYFESARIAYMMRIGMLGGAQQATAAPILASTECRFKRALNFPDQLKVGSRILELHEFGFTHEYSIYSTQQDAIATVGQGRIVMVDYQSNQKVALSNEFQEQINQLEKKSF